MQVIGLSAQEQNDIFRMLAIILWLGNVQFDEMDDGNSKIDDTNVTEFVAYLMETEGALVEKVLTSKIVETQKGGGKRGGSIQARSPESRTNLGVFIGSVYDVPLNPAQASSGRDALMKAIYNNLFEWIVSRVNVSMKPKATPTHLIGVLDIYGFEIFQVCRDRC